LQKNDQPRQATIALSEDELLLRRYPVRLRLAQSSRGRPLIRIVDHPDRPAVQAVRVTE
jgi:hypothetical protein